MQWWWKFVVGGVISIVIGNASDAKAASAWEDRLFSWAPSDVYSVGDFEIEWDNASFGGSLRVYHRNAPGRVLWSSRDDKAFISANETDFEAHEERGSFTIHSAVVESLSIQTVNHVFSKGDAVYVVGNLYNSWFTSGASYLFEFTQAAEGHLRFQTMVWSNECSALFCTKKYNQTILQYESSGQERFFGFGEQFSNVDLKGHVVPILSEEGGLGRGRQPITFLANLIAEGIGGTEYTSYASIPHYLTSLNRSLFLESSEYSVFDLAEEDSVKVTVQSPAVAGRILYGNTPLELIERYTEYAGRMQMLPDWLNQGAIIGMQGGTGALYDYWDLLEQYDTPIGAFWIQDWVGKRKTAIGSQLWWNWELDEDHYYNWSELRSDLEAADIRLMGYVNSYLVDGSPKGTFNRNLIQEALDADLVVKRENGEPYYVVGTVFDSLMLDLTNPATSEWFIDIIQEEMIDKGFSGWMADFSEALPFDAKLYSGADGASYHNRYTEDWAKLNREAIRRAGRDGDIVFFNRAGYTRSPRYSTLFWEGDQYVTWDRYDGFKSSILGLLSGGISGISLNHSDIGGYTSSSNLGLGFSREEKLFLRWAEANAFTAAYRTHEGIQPDENYQFYSNETTLSHFSRFAKVYSSLAPYRKKLMRQAEEKGYPVVRHPYLEFPEDPNTLDLQYQWMLGSEFMVAPVTNKWDSHIDLYLPDGQWVHLWSGEIHNGGGFIQVEAPLGEPGVFYKSGSSDGDSVRMELQEQGVIE